jgi:alpha-1,3-rhamnosyl/mannosyltransferase
MRIAAESTWLAGRTRGLDLVHHAGGTAPPFRTAPYVLTVHDLQPLERQATHGRLKRAYLAAALPRSVDHARAVVVPSDFVRQSLLELTGTDPAKVNVVHHGVTTWPATAADVVRERYGLAGPVVLYPAITYPHKNHGVLVEAFARVVREHPDATLVLSGGADACETTLTEQIHRLGLSAQVRRTGRIEQADLAGLYELASVVAVPSRYEGFGLPAAEAMSFGAPLVAADATALPEVVGGAGLLVDPDDVEGWAGAIARLLADPAERDRLATAGRARAAAFTWRANAEGLVAAYRAALR